ncbi:MAG: hypothetical protein PHU85_05375, partial [Phycisphaerae bacterium]|nr:hypothetical protein [Phycisphaerae bacterium]
GWHDFERLKAELQRRNVTFPPPIALALRKVLSWTTALRYAAEAGSQKEALAFLDAARIIVHWVEERLR